jgi:hypothetical protein
MVSMVSMVRRRGDDHRCPNKDRNGTTSNHDETDSRLFRHAPLGSTLGFVRSKHMHHDGATALS